MAKLEDILVPDIGDFAGVEVIEVLVAAGDQVNAEDPLIVIESDKASIEVPTSLAGIVKTVKVKVGDTVSEGDSIAALEPASNGEAAKQETQAEEQSAEFSEPAAPPVSTPISKPPVQSEIPAPPQSRVQSNDSLPHASPAVRKFARELGADLTRVPGSGPKGRILRSDVQAFIKGELAEPKGGSGSAPLSAMAMPEIDFAKFGEIETQPLSRIKKLSGANLHRNWVVVPHVTQHEYADITELEAFRKQLKGEAEKKGVRLTLLAFLMKAIVMALQEYPGFNASLDTDATSLVLKKYFHIGVAVDTADGLVVPVIRDVDQKRVYELAGELAEVSGKARDKKLSPGEMQGGCFSISSLGGIGGSFFTPIVNAPEVAILGVSRSSMQPVYDGDEFRPRLMLPLSLSYDHRVIDGAQAARFCNFLSVALGDIRRLLL